MPEQASPPQPQAPTTPAQSAGQQSGGTDASLLLQKLIREQEENGNFLLVNALSKVYEATIRGSSFTLGFRPGDSFAKQQVEQDSSELINSFLSDNSSQLLTLSCVETSGATAPAPQPAVTRNPVHNQPVTSTHPEPQAPPQQQTAPAPAPEARTQPQAQQQAPPQQPKAPAQQQVPRQPEASVQQQQPGVPQSPNQDMENETVQQVKDMFRGDIIEDFKPE